METLPIENETAWDDYVLRNQEASFFHLWAWREVIERSFRFRPYYLCSKDQGGKICGILPLFLIRSRLTGRRVTSLPFSYTCGPLGDSEEIITNLAQDGLQVLEKTESKYLEIKADREEETLVKLGFRRNTYYRTYIVPLTNRQENWNMLHKSSTQRSINKAKKDKVRIRFAQDQEELKQFHRLNLGTCRFHGIPPQPYEFLKNVWDILGRKDLVKLALAEYQNKFVAGAFFFLFRDKVYYMYGASDQKYLFCRPNHLLLWETMLWAIDNHYKTFDLGRVSEDNVGLAEFKKRWGGQQRDLYYYYWPQMKGVGATDRKGWKYRLATGVWKRMPLGLTRRGAFLYKHLG